jgi:hypothetical protein
MSQQTGVGQIALGVMLGNLGCFLLWLIFACISFFVLNILGVGLLNTIQRNLR